MFCPRCGSSQSEDLNFCKVCGANLFAVKQVVETRDPSEKFDWSRTWVAEMFLSAAEHKRRKAALERQSGITPEIKRYQEIKAGVIVSSVGIALMIFLSVFMEGLIASGKVQPGSAEILSHIWVAGVIPFFVGLALIVNGVVVSKKLVEAANRHTQMELTGLDAEANPASLRSADTNEVLSSPFSVTEQTTKHLSGSGEK
jgi:hypothetical protein